MSHRAALTLMVLGFFALIGVACWASGSAWPLLALVLVGLKIGDADR